MTTTTIDSLPSASALTGTEELPLVQSGSTKKTTAQDIADLASNIFEGVFLVRNTDLSISGSNVNNFIPWSAAIHETNGNFWDAGSPTYITFPRAGKVVITFHATVVASAGGQTINCILDPWDDPGARMIKGQASSGAVGVDAALTTPPFSVTAGKQYRLNVLFSGSGTFTLVGTSNIQTWFGAWYVE